MPIGQCGVAHAGDDERLAGCVAVCRLPVPETDEQVAAKPDSFPAQVQQQQIVRQHQRQHGTHEKVHLGEKAAVAFLLDHEFGGVQMDEERDERDDQHHHQRKGVEVECNARAESGDIEPYPESLRVSVSHRVSAHKSNGHQPGYGGG